MGKRNLMNKRTFLVYGWEITAMILTGFAIGLIAGIAMEFV